MALSRLAASYGVATSYSPSPGRTLPASDAAVVAALAALGVDASTPDAIRAALAERETHLSERLLPPTVVAWTDEPLSEVAALRGLPRGTRVRVETEGGEVIEWETAEPPSRPRAPAQQPSPPGASPAAASGRSVSPDASAATERSVSPGKSAATEASASPGNSAPADPLVSPGNSAPADPSASPGKPASTERSVSPGNPAPAQPSMAPGNPAPAPTRPSKSPGERVGGWESPPRSGGGGGPGFGVTLPAGVHAILVQSRDGRQARAHLITAPRRIKTPATRSHGLLVQLYSLLSRRSWGMGDLGDLAELTAWSGHVLNTGFVQVNPLHAAVPSPPDGPGGDPSPYRPSSRRFPDPVHLRVEAVPEFAHLTGGARDRADALRREAERLREAVLREGGLIDRDAVWALKREALELLHEVPLGPGRRAAYNAFLAEQGTALEDHATWYALTEAYGPDWHSWPAPLRDPSSPATARARRALMDRVDFHCRLAWLTDTQLAAAQRTAREAGMDIGLVHDLAVGVHPGGADAWAQQEHFAPRMTIGAPPDAFNARGQDWGLPPWRPDRLAASGYAPYRALVRGLLRHAGALRIDHVMGLFRLWWVPEGRDPTEGTYVQYDAEAMLAVLALEAHRADALVIGEDLGTVEPGVRDTLREHGVLGTSVLWFERDWAGTGRPLPAAKWRTDCVATATTHDLPPTAARLTGEHVRLRHDLGLLTRPLAEEQSEAAADVREWLGLLSRLGMLPGGMGCEEDEIRAVHRFLLATPARMLGIWLPDAVGDRRPQNLPGTWDEYPNWRLPIADATGRPVTLEDLAASPRLHALMAVFRQTDVRRTDVQQAEEKRDTSRTAPPGARPV